MRYSWGVRVVFGIGIFGFSAGILASIGKEESWILGGSAVLVIAGCLAWPATIALDSKGITWTMWWRRARHVRWSEVVGIEKNRGGEIRVFDNQGQCILFTRFHIDPMRFEHEVKRRARLKGVIDASAPPTLR